MLKSDLRGIETWQGEQDSAEIVTLKSDLRGIETYAGRAGQRGNCHS